MHTHAHSNMCVQYINAWQRLFGNSTLQARIFFLLELMLLLLLLSLYKCMYLKSRNSDNKPTINCLLFFRSHSHFKKFQKIVFFFSNWIKFNKMKLYLDFLFYQDSPLRLRLQHTYLLKSHTQYYFFYRFCLVKSVDFMCVMFLFLFCFSFYHFVYYNFKFEK